ncbi:hypothetical protein IAD21_02146 [Abditibacteriota bacterium]|nr:hypothetical protein IAD21_02146 [Abditibacteriota bacterium]
MRKILLFPLLLGASSLSLAAPTSAPKPPASTAAKPALEQVKVGELRLDGKISAVVGTGQWLLDAISWTSPRGVTTSFDEVKPKTVQLAPDAFIHPLGSMAKVDVKNIKLKSNIAVIGKNGADGTVQVREVILLEGYGDREMVGTLTINPVSHQLIEQSRRARDAGQLTKALELARQAAETAAGGDPSGEALATQDVGLLYSELKQGKNAVESFKHAQSLGERLHNPMVQVLALEGQGGALAGMGQTDQAITLLEQAVGISAATSSTIRMSVLSSLARVYTIAKKNNEAAGALMRLFPLEEDAGKYDDATETLLSMVVLQATSDPTSAKGHLDEARERMNNIRDDSKRMDLTLAYAAALNAMKDKAGAALQYEAAAKLAEAKGDPAEATRIRALAARKVDVPPAPGAEVGNDAPKAGNTDGGGATGDL